MEKRKYSNIRVWDVSIALTMKCMRPLKSELLKTDFNESPAKEMLYTGLGNRLYIDPKDKDWLLEKLSQREKDPYYPTASLYKNWAEFYKERIDEETHL